MDTSPTDTLRRKAQNLANRSPQRSRRSRESNDIAISRAFKRYNEQVQAERAIETRLRLRQLYEMGLDAAARELDQHCNYCGGLLTPKFIIGYADRLTMIWPDCKCDESKQYTSKLLEDKQKAHLDAQMQLYQARLNNAGLVGWLAKATFDNYEIPENYQAAANHKQVAIDYMQRFLAGDLEYRAYHPHGSLSLEAAIREYNRKKSINNWLILCGNFGNGKSHLSAAIIKAAIDAGRQNVFFRVWPEYLERLKSTFDKTNDSSNEYTQAQIIAELRDGDLVVIDDLDKSQPTEWVKSILYTALNFRYNEGLPTILTFNYSPSDMSPKNTGRLALEDYLGRAVIDRILDISTYIEFNGPSYRSGISWSIS